MGGDALAMPGVRACARCVGFNTIGVVDGKRWQMPLLQRACADPLSVAGDYKRCDLSGAVCAHRMAMGVGADADLCAVCDGVCDDALFIGA